MSDNKVTIQLADLDAVARAIAGLPPRQLPVCDFCGGGHPIRGLAFTVPSSDIALDGGRLYAEWIWRFGMTERQHAGLGDRKDALMQDLAAYARGASEVVNMGQTGDWCVCPVAFASWADLLGNHGHAAQGWPSMTIARGPDGA